MRDQFDAAIEQLALDFFARGRSGEISAEEATTIHGWKAGDPRHQAAYDRTAKLWTELEQLRLDSAILQMREDAMAAIARRRGRRMAGMVLAASLLAGLIVAGAMSLPGLRPSPPQPSVQAQMFTTRLGEITHVDLPDGSTAVLDTNSAIRSRIGAQGDRRIEVLRGRVQFAVAKIPQRPFSVSVRGTSVTALGTRFDVYQRDAGLEINLVEGRLRVTQQAGLPARANQGQHAVEMAAGDRLVVDSRNWRLTRGISAGESDWVKGQLVFENVPIGEVLAELNRYTSRKLTMTDSALAARPISAIIRTDNPTMFLGAIRALNIGEVQEKF